MYGMYAYNDPPTHPQLIGKYGSPMDGLGSELYMGRIRWVG